MGIDNISTEFLLKVCIQEVGNVSAKNRNVGVKNFSPLPATNYQLFTINY
jgi:hypothetical protein